MKTKLLFLVVAALCSFCRAQHVESLDIDGFNGRPQQGHNWCWAASIQAIFLTKGLEVDQASIVTAAYGGIVDFPAPGFQRTLQILNGLAVSIDGSRWKVRAAAGPTFPNAIWAFRKLRKNEPIMIWFRDEVENHSIVINGGDYLADDDDRFISWVVLRAYDPWFDRDMTIQAENIPRYVYGTFDIVLRNLDE